MVDDYDHRKAEEAKHWTNRIAESRFAGIVGLGLGGSLLYILYCLDDVSSDVHLAIGSFLSSLDSATAHRYVMQAARLNRLPKDYDKDDPFMVMELWDVRFCNPVGLGAGFDRKAEAPGAFVNAGFGFVEVGPVEFQDAEAVCGQLSKRYNLRSNTDLARLGVVGAALAGNKGQLLRLVETVGSMVDYVSVDLASVPRSHRDGPALEKLVADLVARAAALPAGPKVLLRVPAFGLEGGQPRSARLAAATDIGKAAAAGGAAGVILCSPEDAEAGGTEASSKELARIVAQVYRETNGGLLLMTSGGVANGRDALDVMEAGATFVQISSLVMSEGPQACRRMKNELSQALMAQGHVSIQEAVGALHRRHRNLHIGKRKNLWKAKAA